MAYILFLLVAWLRSRLADMDAKLGGPHGWLGGFLAAYFALLLFCFSLSIIQAEFGCL